VFSEKYEAMLEGHRVIVPNSVANNQRAIAEDGLVFPVLFEDAAGAWTLATVDAEATGLGTPGVGDLVARQAPRVDWDEMDAAEHLLEILFEDDRRPCHASTGEAIDAVCLALCAAHVTDDDGSTRYKFADESAITVDKGWAATYYDGTEYFDLGAGWGTREQVETFLRENLHSDMKGIEIYEAVTKDGWENWDNAE